MSSASTGLPTVRGYHAHVYYDAETRARAKRLRDEIAATLGVEVRELSDEPRGPHPVAQFRFTFTAAQFENVAPWLMLRLAPRLAPDSEAQRDEELEWLPISSPAIEHDMAAHHAGRLARIYRRIAVPIIRSRRNAWSFLLAVGFATMAVCALFYLKEVTVKLLPFDNKSELAQPPARN